MTREEVKNKLPIIQAFALGKEIQIFSGDKWSASENPDFSLPSDRYRIKPELREYWLGIHKGSDYSCVQAVKNAQGNKPDDCIAEEIIKVREVLQ